MPNMRMTRPEINARITVLEAIIARHEISEANGAEPWLDHDGNTRVDLVTCGTCGLTWNDALISTWTPAPSGRCPYEYIHDEIAELKRLHASKEWTPLAEPYTFVDRPLWWHKPGRQKTVSGYGKQSESRRYVELFDGRIRRVYVTIYSNARTSWINLDGARRIVNDN